MKFLVLLIALSLTACGPKVFKKGEYDSDIERANLLNDKWS